MSFTIILRNAWQKYKILINTKNKVEKRSKSYSNMAYKKGKVNESKGIKTLVMLIIIIILLVIFISKKPAITGKVVQDTETIHSENLNLQINESGAYEWQVKNPGKIKSLKVSGSVSSNGSARVYIEKNGTRQLLFDSAKQLFDVNIHVLPEYKKILQGDKILIENNLFNLRGFGAGNVDVKYSIQDNKGNLIATEEEIVFVETRAKFVRELVMPLEVRPGTYIAFVEASSNGTIVGSGSDTFEVTSKFESKPQLQYYLIGIAAAVAMLIIAVIMINSYAQLKKKKQIAELKEKLPLEKIEKLEKELKALGDARKAGFISEESFKKEKKRLEEKIGMSKK